MARERAAYRDRIIRDPAIMVGEPVVRGTRIPVEKVIQQLSFKPETNELFAIYPELTIEDVRACLSYAQAAIATRQSGIFPPRRTLRKTRETLRSPRSLR